MFMEWYQFFLLPGQSLPGAQVPIRLWPILSLELLFPWTFALRSELARELSFLEPSFSRVFASRYYRSLELSFPASLCDWFARFDCTPYFVLYCTHILLVVPDCLNKHCFNKRYFYSFLLCVGGRCCLYIYIWHTPVITEWTFVTVLRERIIE